MAWKDLSYDKKVTLSNLVSVACAAHNIEWLKKALPTAEDLLEYRDMRNGGGVLHTLMYANDTKDAGAVKFLREIMKTYEVDKNPELKEALFMKRNANGKLAADFSYVYQYMHPESKKAWEAFRGHDVSQMTDMTDRRTAGEKNKIALYNFIKDQVLTIKKESTKEQAHQIIKPYQDRSEANCDQFDKGTPVSDALYLGKSKENGLYVIGSAHEEYPEIRLRNFKNEYDKEDYCVLRGLRPDSSESLLSQAIDKIDFPEDYGEKYFHALNVFEDDYKRLKENESLGVTYRYFTQNRGAVVFEGGEEKIKTNGDKGSYGGYVTAYQTQENGKNIGYPIIVLPCYSPDDFRGHKFHEKYKDMWANNNERPLYHELFHAIDLSGDTIFSEMPIFQYAMMLAETDKNNKIVDPFQIVNGGYPASEYHKEMAAQIMGIADDSVLNKSPLLQRIHKLGQYFAMAKANGKTGVLSSLTEANKRFPYVGNFKGTHTLFMAAKAAGKSFELDENKRKTLEEQLIKFLDKTIAKTESSLGITAPEKNVTQQTR